jgi:malonyl-CoA O-methyltransferase
MTESVKNFKQGVIKNFNRAASRYTQFARLQKVVGDKLLQSMSQVNQENKTATAQQILDLGCGPGLFLEALSRNHPQAVVLAIDMAGDMLEMAKKSLLHIPRVNFICADASQLPIRDGTTDVIFTNLMLQWCPDLQTVFCELKRILKQNGCIFFSILTDGTLRQLKKAGANVNHFVTCEDLATILNDLHAEVNIVNETIVLEYLDVLELMRELKGIGASTLNYRPAAKNQSLKNPFEIAKNYEIYRNNRGFLPATFEVSYGMIKK